VAHWRTTTSRARAAPHSGGTRPAGAYGLPTMRSPANQIDKRTHHAGSFPECVEFTSSLPFVIDICNHPFYLARLPSAILQAFSWVLFSCWITGISRRSFSVLLPRKNVEFDTGGKLRFVVS
jgi:hypothetical protein